MKECLFVSTHEFNGTVVNKPEKDWTKYDNKNMLHSLKAKTIISTALGLVDFLLVSHYEIAKEM